MSFPSSISKSLFHQITLILVPGTLVAAPLWMIVYMSFKNRGFSSLLYFFEHHSVFVCFVLIVMIFLFGLILENLGSAYEEHLDKKFGISKNAWNYFLFSKCGDGDVRVIHKYIDSVVFRYKLELSLIPGLIFFMVEWLILLFVEYNNFSMFLFFFVLLISGGCLWFTWRQSHVSCVYLNKLRLEYTNFHEACKEQILICDKCSSMNKNQCCCYCGNKIK